MAWVKFIINYLICTNIAGSSCTGEYYPWLFWSLLLWPWGNIPKYTSCTQLVRWLILAVTVQSLLHTSFNSFCSTCILLKCRKPTGAKASSEWMTTSLSSLAVKSQNFVLSMTTLKYWHNVTCNTLSNSHINFQTLSTTDSAYSWKEVWT